MSFTITVLPSGKQFQAESDETVLDAGLRAGIVLPYGCKNGACGSCRARVVQGQIEQGPHQPQALRREDARQGNALLCCANACTDLAIEARVVAAAGDIPVRKMPCRINFIERLAPDVVQLKLQLPANDRLQYLAGQYIELILKDGTRRSYSMAGAPHGADLLELHVRHMPGGHFTDTLFGKREPAVKVRDILRFEGPMGTFFLREDSAKPVVFVASGTGFAPIKAIIEHSLHKGIERPMVLYWGGRRPQDLYMDALCRAWATEYPHLRYVPVVSDALPEDNWHGRTGFVHQAVLQDFASLSGHQVYACGAPVVIDSARQDFVALRGLPAEEFFADAFTSAADLQAGFRKTTSPPVA